ncbi:amidohydrolase family protein [Solicola gregarius]|uniref:Amidohydrolase family protein n=1 Tax=Solicola gregarius TaxID=2908642 RepID=A0AA46YMJ4_9ACTN|nr:amidohydrolase family protein [Solicola gregarius]UYM06581.1 amidohydrolase family protein [Solicola gregarius]
MSDSRYAGPIVDAHHHIWRKQDMEWLYGPTVPRIFGSYESIKRDYLMDEYIDDATPSGIVESVYVQANWPLDRVVDEVRWLEQVHRESGWPAAVISCTDLFGDDAVDVMLEQRSISSLVRGTRLQLHWHERPEFRFASTPDAMSDPTFRKNIAALRDLGWLFELQVFAPQMRDAARLVAENPDTPFVLVHAGMLVSQDPAEVEEWRAGMHALAEQPNVVVKLTGQGTFVHRVDAGLIEFVAGEVIDLFGADRAMFGTNFPVEKIWTEMPPLVDAWRDALGNLSAADQHAVFAGNARRVYGLDD